MLDRERREVVPVLVVVVCGLPLACGRLNNRQGKGVRRSRKRQCNGFIRLASSLIRSDLPQTPNPKPSLNPPKTHCTCKHGTRQQRQSQQQQHRIVLVRPARHCPDCLCLDRCCPPPPLPISSSSTALASSSPPPRARARAWWWLRRSDWQHPARRASKLVESHRLPHPGQGRVPKPRRDKQRQSSLAHDPRGGTRRRAQTRGHRSGRHFGKHWDCVGVLVSRPGVPLLDCYAG